MQHADGPKYESMTRQGHFDKIHFEISLMLQHHRQGLGKERVAKTSAVASPDSMTALSDCQQTGPKTLSFA